MKRIKYEVKGMMEWHPIFRVGRSKLRVSFTGGHLCGGACTPASFETSDPVVQAVIENSSAFRSRRIRIGDVRELDDSLMPMSSGASVALNAAKPSVKEEIFEYSDIEDIYEFLQHQKGLSMVQLSSKDSCFREAKKLGIVLKPKNESHDLHP